jgi:hypothetical protein
MRVVSERAKAPPAAMRIKRSAMTHDHGKAEAQARITRKRQQDQDPKRRKANDRA